MSGALELLKRLITRGSKAEELPARYLTKAPGPAQSGRVFSPEEINDLRDQLQFYARPKALPPKHADSLQMLLTQAQDPGVKTHVLYTGKDFTEPSAAFQLKSDNDLDFDGGYLPNLVSLLGLKGQGTQAIREARRSGPYGLVATPGSRGFYEKLIQELPDFKPHHDPDLRGVGYQYKAKGGLVQLKECLCGPRNR